MTAGRKPTLPRAEMTARLMRGDCPKAIAFECGASERAVYALAYAVGLRRHFVTDEEYDRILADRLTCNSPLTALRSLNDR